MTFRLNDQEWYQQVVKLNIDRISVLNIVGVFELVLRHPHLPEGVKQSSIKTGRTLALFLLNEGLIVPDAARRAWEKAFNIPYTVDPDLIVEEFTDASGVPWK